MSESIETSTGGNGHGGARPGAGRKPKDYVKPEAIEAFDEARARNESAKADLNELEFKIKSGEYVARAAVIQATATAYAAIAQTLRSLPDHLERRVALAPEVAEEVGRQIDEALGELAAVFEQMEANDA